MQPISSGVVVPKYAGIFDEDNTGVLVVNTARTACIALLNSVTG